jgi:hypothetical protein
VSNDKDPLERLARVVESAAGDDLRASNFARGLALGALVGAAIAGSTIWQRRHARQVEAPEEGPPHRD